MNIGNADWNNIELAMRLETDIISQDHHFCTDSNGFQVQELTTSTYIILLRNFPEFSILRLIFIVSQPQNTESDRILQPCNVVTLMYTQYD